MNVLITSLLFPPGRSEDLPHIVTTVVQFGTYWEAKQARDSINDDKKSIRIGSYFVIRHAEFI